MSPGLRSSGQLHVVEVVAGLHAGGAELLVAEFAGVAADAGMRISVLSLDGSVSGPAAQRLKRLGIEPVPIGIRSLLNPRDLARVRAAIARRGPDIVHTHLTYPDIVGGLASRSLGIPAISTIHSDHFGPSRRERMKERLAASVRSRCADRVIAVSAQARRTYLDAGLDEPEHVVTVRNGVSARPMPGAGAAIRQQLGIGPGAPVVLMLSVLRAEKQHPVGIEAVRRLRGQYPDLHLLIAGEGPQRATIEAAASGAGDAIHLLGHREDAMRLLDASDVLLHSSSTEAFPTAMVEAMAASVPIVALAVGGIPEIVRNGETGMLVDPQWGPEGLANALETLLSSPERRQRFGAAGRVRYEAELTGDAWARRVRAVYDEALDAGAR